MKKIINWLKSLFAKVKKLYDKYIPVSVTIVQAVKKAIDSGSIDVAADVLKLLLNPAGGITVDKVLKYIKKRIPELCIQHEILNAVNLSDKTEESINQALNALKETYGEKWDSFMSVLAGDLANYLSDGKLDAKEAKQLAKEFYDEYIKNE